MYPFEFEPRCECGCDGRKVNGTRSLSDTYSVEWGKVGGGVVCGKLHAINGNETKAGVKEPERIGGAERKEQTHLWLTGETLVGFVRRRRRRPFN